MEYVTLNNGIKMPMAGIGVFMMSPAEAQSAVENALKSGVRLIDTANGYMNESGTGRGIKSSGVARKDIFLVTKLWPTVYEKETAIDESLKRLDTDYIDLLFLHQPTDNWREGYKAIEKAYKEGKVKAIGVSNFYPDRLIDLCSFVEVKPAINQVETHIFQQQKTAHEYMEKYGVQHESWGPFAEGRNDFFTNPVLNEIGKKHGKSAAQVALRFLLQSDVVVIPKSTHKERMEENINVFDFALDASDMNAIRALDEKESLFFSHYDPAIAEMMIKHLSCLDLRSRII